MPKKIGPKLTGLKCEHVAVSCPHPRKFADWLVEKLGWSLRKDIGCPDDRKHPVCFVEDREGRLTELVGGTITGSSHIALRVHAEHFDIYLEMLVRAGATPVERQKERTEDVIFQMFNVCGGFLQLVSRPRLDHGDQPPLF